MAERQGGSVLMLVPAAVLVLVVLGSIAVDFAIAFLGQRELTGAAAAAANDAAAAAISDATFYRGSGPDSDRIEVDDEAARGVVDAAVRARAPRGVAVTGVSVQAPGAQVCVTLRGEVEYLFAKALPWAPHKASVEGRATATAVEGPAGTGVPPRTIC
jgi:Flp pilus assembly protein TadG